MPTIHALKKASTKLLPSHDPRDQSSTAPDYTCEKLKPDQETALLRYHSHSKART